MPLPPSKFQKYRYRRNLPHIQGPGPLFLTFRVIPGFELPESVRDDVMEHCLYDHHRRIFLRCAIVMPDHVHLIFSLRHDPAGIVYALSEVMDSIKGASSHTVNRLLHRKGHVWQDESFDHAIRHDESLTELVAYVANNPVRRGLAKTPRDYPWFFADPCPSNYIPRQPK